MGATVSVCLDPKSNQSSVAVAADAMISAPTHSPILLSRLTASSGIISNVGGGEMAQAQMRSEISMLVSPDKDAQDNHKIKDRKLKRAAEAAQFLAEAGDPTLAGSPLHYGSFFPSAAAAQAFIESSYCKGRCKMVRVGRPDNNATTFSLASELLVNAFKSDPDANYHSTSNGSWKMWNEWAATKLCSRDNDGGCMPSKRHEQRSLQCAPPIPVF